MKNLITRLWTEDEGVLTFEWILLISLLVIAMIGGLATVRDALLNELNDLSVAISLINQSYTVAAPPPACGNPTGVGFSYTDSRK